MAVRNEKTIKEYRKEQLEEDDMTEQVSIERIY